MPSALTYPGVYVEEIPSGVRTITAVPVSITAFVGRARKGPTNEAVEITSFGDYERIFGGLWGPSSMSYAVRDFYLNGGTRAVIVRLVNPTFADPEEAKKRADAAEQVAKAAADKNNGKDAKAAAKTKNDEIQNGDAEEFEKAAAQAAFDTINKLADDAKQKEVKIAVASAVGSTTRTMTIGPVRVEAKNPGKWAANLRLTVERPYDATGNPISSAKEAAKALGVDVADIFTLTVTEEGTGGNGETFANVTLGQSIRRTDKVLKNESRLIVWAGDDLDTVTPKLSDVVPDPTEEQKKQKNYEPRKGDDVVEAQVALKRAKAQDPDPTSYRTQQDALDTAIQIASASVTNGGDLTTDDFLPRNGFTEKKGLYALEQLFARGGLFNLLCIPPYQGGQDISKGVMAAAAALCEERRAMFIVDPPAAWTSVTIATNNFGTDVENLPRTKNAAVFFPRIRQSNPLHNDQIEDFPPCGVVAGIFARTDVERGVWKSPAGLDASLKGVSGLSVPMTDDENGLLNPLGINCLRTFPVFGKVVWGARTLRGADDYADEYKYIAVRRLALLIEESLYRGLKWVVFEPNDEPLWAQIRLNAGAFMHNLFRQGAFQGASPREAYFVKCDAETTTQNDINLGIVNIIVGFAPLKPAEFVVIKFQQMTGQIET
jgi:Bacteriophage tail sheath protein